MADYNKTPAEIENDARQVGRDAANAAQGIADDAKAIGANTVQALRPAVEDAKATAREAADTVKGLAADAKEIAGDTVDSATDYAKNTAKSVADAAAEKLRLLKLKAADAQTVTAQYIADEPIKAVLIGVAAGALLATLLLNVNRPRRY